MPSKDMPIEDLLAEAAQMIRDTKKKVCRECKEIKTLVQSGFCEDCQRAKMEARAEKRKNARHVQSSGYVYVYDDNDKLVLEHRYVMEQHLGRPLTANEVVLHLDGTKDNNDLTNLVLGFKNGTPLDRIKCTECHSVGQWTLTDD